MPRFENGKKVVLKSNNTFWYISQVYPNDKYEITADTQTGFITTGCVVTYVKDNEKYYVIQHTDSTNVTIENDSGKRLNVDEKELILVGSLNVGDDVVYTADLKTYVIRKITDDKTYLIERTDDKKKKVTLEVSRKKLQAIQRKKGGGGYRKRIVDGSEIDEISTLAGTTNGYPNFLSFENTMKKWLEELKVSDKEPIAGVWRIIKRIVETEYFESYTEERLTNWLGEKHPKTYQEAMERFTYQDMEKYQKFKDNILAPLVEKLLKESYADVARPKMVYNDLEIGMFDFAKASTNLLTSYVYYSVKHKKQVPQEEVVVKINSKGEYVYLYKLDGSKIILLPVINNMSDVDFEKMVHVIDSGGDIIKHINENNLLEKMKSDSTVQKSYLYKQNKKKPMKAVRLFLNIGANSYVKGQLSEEYFKVDSFAVPALTAIGITELLEQMGYTVNLNALLAIQLQGDDKMYQKLKDGKYGLADGVRVFTFPLKRFDETINPETLLYYTADPSFFRVKWFQYIVSWVNHFKDNIDDELGHVPREDFGHTEVTDILQPIIFKHFLKNEPNQGILYFFLGGIYNVEELRKHIKSIVDDVESANKHAREIEQLS